MDRNKLILPVAIVLGSLIVGGFVFATQVNKQNSIERQKQWEIEQEDKKLQAEEDKLSEEKSEKIRNELKLSICLDGANDKYWGYMKLNGTEEEDGTINAPQYRWDFAEKMKQAVMDNCYKQFK